MASISGLLITVRSAKQGAAMVTGKTTLEYRTEITTLRLAPEDLAELELTPGQRALLTSPYGEAAVTCQKADGPRGLFFLPLGPVANQVIGAAQTHGTGVPDWKGMKVTLTPYDIALDPKKERGECE
ncbi:MAG: molybdopterin dinucleotide binding domain-containing protein [Negativicutes bacterium]|nr:molybdopterin dinucleotide binding domain-containing protein [Negativicutes bacterium]